MAPATTAKKALVLIVDDDRVVREMAHDTLATEGFSVVEAKDGLSAIEVFKKDRPDLILLDVIMPVLDGYRACEEIRNLSTGKDIPILMMTALDDVKAINRCYEAGATNFITKPLNWNALSHHVSYMLRNCNIYAELCKSEERLARAQRIANIGNWEWDIASDCYVWSNQIYGIFGCQPDALATFEEMISFIHADERENARAEILNAIETRSSYSFKHRIIMPDSSFRHLQQQGEVSLGEEGHGLVLSGTIQDITELRVAEERIAHLAFHDNLTGLPNRYLLKDRLSQAVKQAQRNETLVAVVFIDLDRFKRINDTLGHVYGDQLLEAVAIRLTESVRCSDTVAHMSSEGQYTLARLGGDEFCLLINDFKNMQDVVKVVRRIQKAISQPFTLGEHHIFITVSIGISLFPHDGEETDILLKNADSALHFAKSQGRDNWQFYTESLNSRALHQLILEGNLLKALERDEFVLYYQPVLDLRTGAIIGMEALARWQHPDQGLIFPNHFIPLAEETGLIVPFVEWTLRTACRDSFYLRQAGLPPLRVAVNLPSRQFMQKDLTRNLIRILEETGHDPKYLELEITEGTIMQNEKESISTLSELKEMGIRIAIDDFGTGYSSLSYLTQFPLDTLKVDRSFLQEIPHHQSNSSITKAIIAMAQTLKLEVVAEGVETEEQLRFLRDLDCDYMQGFLYSPAVPIDQFKELMRKGGMVLSGQKNDS